MSWIRTPLLHFLAIGALIFAVDAGRRASSTPPSPGKTRIEIDAARLELLERDFVARTGRAPSSGELERLVADEVDREILYREALALGMLERDGGVQTRLIQKMLFLEGAGEIDDAAALWRRAMELGLHEDDVVIRRILVEKMRLLGSALPESERPSEDVIARRYAEEREGLRDPDRVSFVHVFFSRDDRGASTSEDALALRERLARDSTPSDQAARLGDPFPLGHRFRRRSEDELARSFGARFARDALEIQEERWSPPIESAYGSHLLWIDEREPGRIPPLARVADRIRHEIERELRGVRLERLLARLRTRYEVSVHDAAGGAP